MKNNRNNHSFRLLALAAAMTATVWNSPASAENSFRLVESEPLEIHSLLQAARDSQAPALNLAEAATPSLSNIVPTLNFESAPSPETDGAGCSIDPASPSIGANVPESYFGVPSPTINPSLVGAVQLLTSGELNTRRREITVPLYRGRMAGSGETVWYVATDTTDAANAEALGINFSAKLAFAGTGRGVRRATLEADGTLVFESGTVDFSPERRVQAAAEPNPFPPTVAEPGSVGDENYTPLVLIENAGGHVYNLPIIAFGSTAGQLRLPGGAVNYAHVHDSVSRIRPFAETVTLDLVPGFSFGRPVLYLSLDTNLPLAAALEGATFAPGLADISVGADDSLFSAVERIFGFTNGARGCENPNRQGFEAAVTDGSAPFNVLGGIPTIAPDYSPLWDLNLGEWTQEAIDAGYRSRLIDEFQILGFVDNGFVTGPGGTEYGSSGIIINCPIVHRFL